MNPERAAKILVVDDEPAIRDLIVAVLEDEGYEVLGANSGPKALELLPVERPDLVLMDIMMPEMDGREAFRQMQEQQAPETVPVVMMSAAFAADRVPAEVAAFLPKPFDLDHLLATVERVLSAHG